MDRRSLLLGTAALALGACKRPGSPAPGTTGAAPVPPPPGGAWKQVSFAAGVDTPEGERAFLLQPWPADAAAPDPPARPLLVALHGRGEAGRGLDVGAGPGPTSTSSTACIAGSSRPRSPPRICWR